MNYEVKIGNRIGDYIVKDINGHHATCKCVWCGNIDEKYLSELKYGQRCRCHNHGNLHDNPLYSVWREMNRRCYSPNCCNYSKYGAIGIKVCDDWLRDCDGGKDGYLNFKTWAENNGYKQGLTLDRINPYKNYTPDNCRWTTYHIQNTHLVINKNNTSGYVGVSWCDHRGQVGWRSRIKINNKQIELGVFQTKREALEVRNNYIINNNLPHKIQEYIGENGYCKETYEKVFVTQ